MMGEHEEEKNKSKKKGLLGCVPTQLSMLINVNHTQRAS